MAQLGNGQTFKVLAQATATASLATLYTVPASTSTVISKLVVCNTDTASKTFAIQVAIAGAASAVAQYQYKDFTIAANDTLELLQGMTLATTDLIRIIASVTTLVSFTLYGQEFQ